jgi:hypothetical protein
MVMLINAFIIMTVLINLTTMTIKHIEKIKLSIKSRK